MITQFFSNACILVTFISITNIILTNKNEKLKSKQFMNILNFFADVITGLLGIVLMLYSVNIDSNVIIDLRYIPIVLGGVYRGPLSSLFICLEIAVFRLLYFGMSKSSIVGFTTIAVVGAITSIISAFKISRKNKWILSMVSLLVSFFISMYILEGITERFFKIILIYFIGNILVAYILYIYSENLMKYTEYSNKLRDDATKDFLTGLNNVRKFNEIFKLNLDKKRTLALLIIDIDYFKNINDTYGHIVGDMILKDLAKVINNTISTEDVVSRNGGEEFSILVFDSSQNNVMELAEKLRRRIELHKFYISDELEIKITISIGVSIYPSITFDAGMVFDNADKALYEAKETGRNKVVLYK